MSRGGTTFLAGFLIYLLLTLVLIYAQERNECLESSRCYDSDLTLVPGDKFNWDITGIKLKFASLPTKLVNKVDLEVLKAPNSRTASFVDQNQFDYFKMLMTYELEQNGSIKIEQISLSTFDKSFISATRIMINSQFVNYFEYQALVTPETMISFETYSIDENTKTIKTTIYSTNKVQNNIFIQAETSSSVETSPIGDTKSWSQRTISHIEIETGLLLNLTYELSDSEGELVDFASIKRSENTTMQGLSLDLGIPGNPVYFLALLAIVIAFPFLLVNYKTGKRTRSNYFSRKRD